MHGIGKNVEIYLTTPLFSATPKTTFGLTIKGKLVEKAAEGCWIQIEKSAEKTHPHETIFIPMHKIDFIGLVNS